MQKCLINKLGSKICCHYEQLELNLNHKISAYLKTAGLWQSALEFVHCDSNGKNVTLVSTNRAECFLYNFKVNEEVVYFEKCKWLTKVFFN
jgi:hypothetical protein